MNYKPIRNRLSKLAYPSLVRELLEILKGQEKSSRPQPFWQGLLLLRWAMEFGGRNYPLKETTRKDIIKLFQEIEDLERAHDLFYPGRNGGNIKKTFIILSLQQMVYQEKAWWGTLARQQILFTKLRHKYDINQSFEKLTGIPLKVFFKIIHIYLLVLLNESTPPKQIPSLSLVLVPEYIQDNFGTNIWKKLIDIWGISKESIAKILEKDLRQIRNYDLQVFEPSIFGRRPLFLFNNSLIIPHRDILHITINHFIYEFMKHKDPEFSPELGLRMEKYVALGLVESGLSFRTENELKSQLGKQHHLVDFIIEENIVVEVKAIEVKPYTAANPTDELLAKEFKQNVIKAYCQQMLSVVSTLQAEDKEYFGIIITYRDLMLGNATDLWEQFLEEGGKKGDLNSIGFKLLPIKNLFILDISTWDILAQIIKSKQVGLKELLIKIRETDKDPVSKKYNFRMHLDEYSDLPIDLSYLLEAKKQLD